MHRLAGSAAAALAIAMTAGAAAAADLPGQYYTAPGPLSSYSWTGPYLGLNLGYQWGRTSNNPTRPSGPEGGIQGGYNWQLNHFVFGGEADLQISGADDVFAPWKFANPWFGTLRVRAGYAMNNILFYATGGLAYGSLRAETLGLLTETKTSVGWTAGGGAEIGLTPNWSAKVEYLYISLADRAYSLTGANNGLSTNVVRLGVNYRF